MTDTSLDFKLGKIVTELENLQHSVDEIKADLKGEFIRREEFEPIKRVVYYGGSLVAAGLVAELLFLLLR